MAQYTGWRNFWWLNVALLALVTIMLTFGFPETKWHRLHQNKLDQRGLPTATSSAEKFEPDKKGGSGDLVTRNVSQDLADSPTESRDHYLGKGKPSRSQFGFYQPNSHPFKSMLLDIWIPWKLFAFPIVEFAAFVVSWSCSSFLTLNLTQSEVFAHPPYDFHPVAVGFTNFAIVVGALIGLAIAGPLSDWISMRLTIRNGGVREPEMRLPSMIPYVLIMMLGNFIVAFGYEHRWSWKVPTLFCISVRYNDWMACANLMSRSLSSSGMLVPVSRLQHCPQSLRPTPLTRTSRSLGVSSLPLLSTRTCGATASRNSSRLGLKRAASWNPS